MFLIKWRQEVLQHFLFKDLIRRYLLFMSCSIPFPAQSCQDLPLPPFSIISVDMSMLLLTSSMALKISPKI